MLLAIDFVNGYEERSRVGNISSQDSVRVTIHDVAAAAGVSIGTVSRVINRRKGVKPETRQAVSQTIERLGFQPDQTARELSFRHTARIGMHIRGARHLTPFYMLFLESIMEALQVDGYRLEEIPSLPNGLPTHLVDGMILFGAHDDDPRVEHMARHETPFVLVGHQEGTRWVAPDDYSGGLQATRHLIRLGHEKILHVTGTLAGQGEFDRYRGYVAALNEAGLAPARQYLLNGEFSTLGAYRAVRRALEAGLEFSAVFAASDEMAVGVIAAIEDMDFSIPTDISVVGFDDLPEVAGDLTTVHQDIPQIATTAIELLKEGLSGAAIRHRKIPVRLVVRGTTARKR